MGSASAAVVHERRLGLLLLGWQRHPGLDAEQALTRAAALGARALGMDDAAPGAHPVHRAGLDRLLGPQAVAVQDLALEQVGQRREVDVRVGAHVDALVGQELRRPHLVEEDERADHLPLGGGQRAPDGHFAEVDRARHDQRLDRVRGPAVAEHGVGTGAPAHRSSPSVVTSWLRRLGKGLPRGRKWFHHGKYHGHSVARAGRRVPHRASRQAVAVPPRHGPLKQAPRSLHAARSTMISNAPFL